MEPSCCEQYFSFFDHLSIEGWSYHFFNAIIALALQMSKIYLINFYLILKLLVFASIGQLNNSRYLLLYRFSL